MNMLAYDQFETPHGTMLVTATGKGLAGVYFKGQKHFPKKDKLLTNILISIQPCRQKNGRSYIFNQ